jgi:hypothetical protein
MNGMDPCELFVETYKNCPGGKGIKMVSYHVLTPMVNGFVNLEFSYPERYHFALGIMKITGVPKR